MESVGGVLVGLNGRPMSLFSGTCPLLSASLKFRFSRASVCLAGMQALEKISSRFMLADFKFHPAEYQNLDIEVESEQPCLRSCWRLQANVILNAVATLQKRQTFLIQHDPSNRQIELIAFVRVCALKFGLAFCRCSVSLSAEALRPCGSFAHWS